MICQHCNAQVPDDGLYCPNCGQIASGDKKCPTCSKIVKSDAAFCTYCGTRLDGKHVCTACGTTFEGTFCPSCGVKHTATVAKNGKKANNEPLYARIERILTPTLMLCALLALFICSFFIGIDVIVNGEAVAEEGVSVFYFFGDAYNDVSKAAQELIQSVTTTQSVTITQANVEVIEFSILLPTIINTVVLAANLILGFTMLLIGAIKYGMGLYKEKKADISRYAVIAFAAFIATAFIAVNFMHTNVKQNDDTMFTTLSDGSLAGIIAGGVLVIAAMVTRAIANINDGQAKGAYIARLVLSAASVILLMVGAGIANLNALTLGAETQANNVTTTTKAFYSPSAFTSAFYVIFAVIEETDVVLTMRVLLPILYCLGVVFTALTGVVIYKVMHSLFAPKDKWQTPLITPIIMAVAAIAFMVLAIVSLSQIVLIEGSINENAFLECGGVIATAVLALIAFGCQIANLVIERKTTVYKN